ncbi:hypothetical protein [Pseudomonas sp. FME51]|uniref:hypothetical protein n=1 Tax=Pseudomonas sp. FME51 TaxID=2742609 RepID=UPI001869528B|nr:hypothetical protein [Pseudomonas sp. FME51]
MNEFLASRPLIEVNSKKLPEVYAPQSVVIKGIRSDGVHFKVDIGRVCYLERAMDSEGFLSGKHYIPSPVNNKSLSLERVEWLKNYLYTSFHKGWRDETLRQNLHCLRHFFHFCDFDGGLKPTTLEGLVSEYKRYQIILDQKGRLNGGSSLKPSSILKRLNTARSFIQWAFQLSNNEILALIPKHRSRQSTTVNEGRSVSLQDGQDYLRACAVYFNQFADSILNNQYPIPVSPPYDEREHLYWHSSLGTSLVSLPNCFTKEGEPLPFQEIKDVLAKNFKSKLSEKSDFYDRALVRNRNEWMNGKLIPHKVYAYNLSVFCFFQIYLAFTAANVQPTLDLKIADIDLSKVGSSAFAKKHKFRAGRTVKFEAPNHLKREIIKYFKLREWAESLGLPGDAQEYLFVKIGEKNKLQRFDRSSGSVLIRKSILFKGLTKISSRDIRQLTGEYFIRKSQGKVSLVAKKLNNSIATTARAYTSIDIESQAKEMNRYHEELSSQVKYFNRTASSPLPVSLASEDESERIASGACTNMNGEIPSRANGFNSKAPEPTCGTFESCLFCEYFAVHEDFEDVHKLLSLREALNATSIIRNDSEHHEAVVKPAIFRIDEILGFVSKNNRGLEDVIRQAEDEIEMGNYNRHWSRQIEILTRLASSAGRG